MRRRLLRYDGEVLRSEGAAVAKAQRTSPCWCEDKRTPPLGISIPTMRIGAGITVVFHRFPLGPEPGDPGHSTRNHDDHCFAR
jgi:hypothetical protein